LFGKKEYLIYVILARANSLIHREMLKAVEVSCVENVLGSSNAPRKLTGKQFYAVTGIIMFALWLTACVTCLRRVII
jgi:hypothetical protein